MSLNVYLLHHTLSPVYYINVQSSLMHLSRTGLSAQICQSGNHKKITLAARPSVLSLVLPCGLILMFSLSLLQNVRLSWSWITTSGDYKHNKLLNTNHHIPNLTENNKQLTENLGIFIKSYSRYPTHFMIIKILVKCFNIFSFVIM
jgi:hypothetical protein